jgi:hypothetical protein
VLHELVEYGHLKQIEAARRLHLTNQQMRLPARLRTVGDGGIVHRLRGRRSNRKIAEERRQRALHHLRQARYAGFGLTLAAEHLARSGTVVSRETLPQWITPISSYFLKPSEGPPSDLATCFK